MNTLNESEKFRHISQKLLDELLCHDPVAATYLGRHDYDGLLPDPSIDGMKKGHHILENALSQLLKLDKTQLSQDERLDIDLLVWQVEISRFMLETKRYEIGGFPVETFLGAIHPLFAKNFASPRNRAESIEERLSGAEQYFDKAKELFIAPVKIFVEDEIYGCQSGTSFIDTVVESFEGKIAAEHYARLKSVGEKTKTTLKNFQSWLETSVMPRAAMNYQFGRENMSLLIDKRQLGLTMEEIRTLGREEFINLEKDIETEAISLGFSSLAEAMDSIQKDVPEGFDKILTAYKDAIDLSKKEVTRVQFATLPENEELVIEQTPVHLERTIPSAAYEPPEALSKAPHEGTYLVTRPLSKEHELEHNLASILNVSFHEAYPGHHLQSVYSARNNSSIRKIINGLEFIEGWAHYCEEEMYFLTQTQDKGNGTPGLRLAQLLDARYRALRIELDIGLHCGDISYEEGQQMMIDKLGLSRETAKAETGWYCREPGYALSYLLGKVLFKRLRKECEELEGTAFSMKEFHNKILRAGSLPMWAIRKIALRGKQKTDS